MSTILLFFALATATGTPADAEALFVHGNALYGEGDFYGALAAYERAEDLGWTSAALHLNASTAALRTGDLARARLHSERARRLARGDDDVQHQVALVRSAVGEPAARPPTVRAAIIQRTAEGAGAPLILAVALTLWAALFLLIGLRVTGRVEGAWIRRGTLVLAMVTVMCMALAAVVVREVETPRGVVMGHSVHLADEPGETSGSMAPVSAGRLVILGPVRGTWRRATLPDGSAGWLPNETVEEI